MQQYIWCLCPLLGPCSLSDNSLGGLCLLTRSLLDKKPLDLTFFSALIFGNKPTSNITQHLNPNGLLLAPHILIFHRTFVISTYCNFNRCKGLPYVQPSSYLYPKPLYPGFLDYALLSFPLSCSACLSCLLSSAAWEIHGLGSDPLYASLFSCSLLLCLLASHAFAQNAPFLCFSLSCHHATAWGVPLPLLAALLPFPSFPYSTFSKLRCIRC